MDVYQMVLASILPLTTYAVTRNFWESRSIIKPRLWCATGVAFGQMIYLLFTNLDGDIIDNAMSVLIVFLISHGLLSLLPRKKHGVIQKTEREDKDIYTLILEKGPEEFKENQDVIFVVRTLK